jgi:hypothetical protein
MTAAEQSRERARAGLFFSFLAAAALSFSIFLLIVSPFAKSAAAPVRITDDYGGKIGDYWARYRALRDSKDRVEIDGTCSSACTLVLGIVPARRICVTANARLGFHAAWRPGILGLHVINGPATRTLMSLYPVPVRQWILRNGGLGERTIYLSGPDLTALYRPCR